MATQTANYLTLVLSLILISAATITSHEISEILKAHSQFSTFNDLLSQTGVSGDINNRKTITVFVVENGKMGSISGKPIEIAKHILETHVALDFYDIPKLTDLAHNGEALTTLFQATGEARGQQGYLRAKSSGGHEVGLGSAVDKAPQSSKVVKSVAAEPYNISVIQISHPIMTPGIEQMAPAGRPKASSEEEAESPKKHGEKGEAPSEKEGKDENSYESEKSPSPEKGGSEGDKSSDSAHKNGAGERMVGSFGGLVVPAVALMGLASLAL